MWLGKYFAITVKITSQNACMKTQSLNFDLKSVRNQNSWTHVFLKLEKITLGTVIDLLIKAM